MKKIGTEYHKNNFAKIKVQSLHRHPSIIHHSSFTLQVVHTTTPSFHPSFTFSLHPCPSPRSPALHPSSYLFKFRIWNISSSRDAGTCSSVCVPRNCLGFEKVFVSREESYTTMVTSTLGRFTSRKM